MQNLQPEITVIFEDTDILVISKPAGITVNRADTTKDEVTVQDWAEGLLDVSPLRPAVAKAMAGEQGSAGQAKVSKEDNEKYPFDPVKAFYDRGGIVHRLDKETSGILLIAKNPEAFIELQRQFKERIVKKTYLALAHGKVVPTEGEINIPVGRLPWNRRQFGVVAGGREAITKYKTLSVFNSLPAGRQAQLSTEPLSLVELYPETGRTHQIRVHLKYLGHPIFADFLYAGRKTQRDDRKLLSRVFLHAAKITFLHPRTQASETFESPLPEELQKVLRLLQK